MGSVEDVVKWALVLGIPTVLLAIGIVLGAVYPPAKLIISDVARFFGFLGKAVRKLSVSSEIEGRLNALAAKFNAETPNVVLPDCRVHWVTANNVGAVLSEGKVVLRVSFGHDAKSDLVNAVSAFIQVGLLPNVKPFIGRTTRRALDLVVTRNLLRDAHRDALSVFNERFLDEPDECRQLFALLEDIDDHGLLSRILIPELDGFGAAVALRAPMDIHATEITNFIVWLYDLATREAQEDSQLAFRSTNISVGVILVAREEIIGTHGIDPYTRRAQRYAADGYSVIYLVSRGPRRAVTTVRIAEFLAEEAYFEQLTRKPSFRLRLPDGGEELITCIGLHPNQEMARLEAWRKVSEAAEAKTELTATVKEVLKEFLGIDLFGLSLQIPSGEVSGLMIPDLRRFFVRNQELSIRVLNCDSQKETAVISIRDTASDPKAFVDEVAAHAEESVDATVREYKTSKDATEVGIVVELPGFKRFGYLPRRGCTFSRFVPLSLKFPVGTKIPVVVHAFSMDFGTYGCQAATLRDPWDDITQVVGENAQVTVREVTENYVCCELGEGIEGYASRYELTWDPSIVIKDAINEFNAGETRVAKIIGIDPVRRRFQLSFKRTEATATEMHALAAIGSVETGIVTSVGNREARLAFGEAKGFLPLSELSWGYVDDCAEILSEHDELEVRLLQYDSDFDSIRVSAKRVVEVRFDLSVNELKVGDDVEMVISRTFPQHLDGLITLGNGAKANANIHISQLSTIARLSDLRTYAPFAAGKKLRAVISRFNDKLKVVDLSRKPLFAKSWDLLAYGDSYSGFAIRDSRNKLHFYGDRFEAQFTEQPKGSTTSNSDVRVILARKGSAASDVTVALE